MNKLFKKKESLETQIQLKLKEMEDRLLQSEDAKREILERAEEFERGFKEREEKMRHKEALLQDYQKTIVEQRQVIEKKRLIIEEQERKIQELLNEIKLLLQPSRHPPSPILKELSEKRESFLEEYVPHGKKSSSYDLSFLMERYKGMAESYLSQGGFQESCDLDLRRLFDALKNETKALILLYSDAEKRLLFANSLVKTYLGWTRERFVKEFAGLLVMGHLEFKKQISGFENTFHLLIQSKTGEELLFSCLKARLEKSGFAHLHLILLTPIDY